MPLFLPSAFIRRSLCLALPVAMVLSLTGCEESQRLSAETAATSKKVVERNAQLESLRDDYSRLLRATDDLQKSPALKKGGAGPLEAQVKALTERKQAIETEIAALHKDQDAYLKANP